MSINPEDRMIISIPNHEGPGIYMIKNIVTGKVYIGSAKNVRSRIKQHDLYMRRGWCNNKFQEDIDKGYKFTCEMVEQYDSITLLELRDRELYFVMKYNCYDEGYNVAHVPTYERSWIEEGSYLEKWLLQQIVVKGKNNAKKMEG